MRRPQTVLLLVGKYERVDNGSIGLVVIDNAIIKDGVRILVELSPRKFVKGATMLATLPLTMVSLLSKRLLIIGSHVSKLKA